MNQSETDLHNIIDTDNKYQKILYNIKVHYEPFVKGFADFIPEYLDDTNKLFKWLNDTNNISIKRELSRRIIIKKNLEKEQNELSILKKQRDNFYHLFSFYNSQKKLANKYLDSNNLELNDNTISNIKNRLEESNKIKIDKINEHINENNVDIYNNIKNILDKNNQLRACLRIYKIQKKHNMNNDIIKKYTQKKKEYLNKLNKLNVYTGAVSGINIERIGFSILKLFAKKLGNNYYVGEIKSNHIWKMKEKKRKGMKQDIDGFIFKVDNNKISVVKIYEFKSSHYGIITDINKINKLLDFLLIHDFTIYLSKDLDDVFRPSYKNKKETSINKINSIPLSFIMNRSSFNYLRFNNINRYHNIVYLFGLSKEVKYIQFQYITLSQFNKVKVLENINDIQLILRDFLKNNISKINIINKIADNGGLIGILISS